MRLKQIAIALDQLANALAGGFADETWSARCWRERRWRWVRFLDRFDADHCANAYLSEALRRHLPMHYRLPPEERV